MPSSGSASPCSCSSASRSSSSRSCAWRPVDPTRCWGAALRGDLGRSFKTNDPVATLIVDRLGPTLQLTAGALLFAIAVAVPLGVLAAVRRGSVWDTVGSAVSLFGVSFPSFWLGITLILLFSEGWHLLPPSGLSEYGR